MAFIVTNSSELTININDGWKDLDIPKFRLYMQVDEPNITIWWADNEKGKQGITRNLVMDYNDVLFGAYAPSSATEIQSIINGYIISAWTDIIAMLGNYVPYIGASTNVDLGTFGLTTDYVAWDLNPVASPGAGQIAYDGTTGSLSYLLNNSNVVSNIGQTLHAYVHNAEGSPLTKGQVVYLYEASGNKASVKLARNLSDSTSAKTFGLCAEDIPTNQNGMVICQGKITNLDTSAFNDGDTLYLANTYGDMTNVKPYAPEHLVYVGVVEKASNGNGEIYVRPQNGYELDEIHDVDLITTPPSTGDVLTYNGSLWVNQAPASGTGTVTSIATTSPITGGTITTSGTIGINQATSIQDGYLSSADWSTFNNKQATLVSGTNIKTINGNTLLGSGDITISGSGLTHQEVLTRTLGS